MAGYRQIHTKIWKDDWFMDLTAEEKVLFVYLFSNDEASISGIYKLGIRVMANETGLSQDFIRDTLKMFAQAKKVFYQDGVVWVVKMSHYHKNASPKTMTKVNNDLAVIPDCELKKRYLYYQQTGKYDTDTVSIPDSESRSASGSSSEIPSRSASEMPEEPEATASAYGPEVHTSPTQRPDIFTPQLAETIMQQVTGWISIPAGDRDAVIDALGNIFARKGSQVETVAYLLPFWRAARARYPSSVRCFWVTDWAVAGKVPDAKKNGNGKGYQPPAEAETQQAADQLIQRKREKARAAAAQKEGNP